MKGKTKYILMLSIHGLIRGKNLELGRDADTGGQTKYVIEITNAAAKHRKVERVDLMTRLIKDSSVGPDYAQEIEPMDHGAQIVRIPCGRDEYIRKEELWDCLDNFVDNAILYLKAQKRLPDVIHSHYADAGYVGSRLSRILGIPLVHTGHSLGRSKRRRLLAGGLNDAQIEERYHMKRRIDAEEEALGAAELVITSTSQEVEEQYAVYDYYQPDQMRVIPPGTDILKFHPPTGKEYESAIARSVYRFLRKPGKPLILALSRPDHRKNILSLISAYGESQALQREADLVVVAGNRDDIREMDIGAQEVLTELLMAVDRHDLYGNAAYPKTHSSDDVPVLYRLAALSKGVFINPALTEPFGLTLIEAAATGLPIVSTEDGGPVDIIGNCNNGFLINPLDTDEIARRLLELLTDFRKWGEFAQNGLDGVARHYTWDSHVRTYLKTLQPLIEDAKWAPRASLKRRSRLFHNGAIISDLDQNLLGDSESRIRMLEELKAHRKTIAFCIATGRSRDSALALMRQFKIPTPDVLITSMGTEIYYNPHLNKDTAWTNHIEHMWNRKAIVRILSEIPGLIRQPRNEQGGFKVSYYYDPEQAPSVDEIRKLLLEQNQTVNTIFSFGQYLDILPERASKGYAVRWMAEQRNIPLDHILTAGGSGADQDMMRGNTLSVVVANRHHEELDDLKEIEPIYFSPKSFAAGILDGIAHYDFFTRCEES